MPSTAEILAHGPLQRPHFNIWYNDWADDFNTSLHGTCSSQYDYYLTNSGNRTCTWCAIGPIVDCLLDNTPESRKANMAAAGVILGLLPTVLSLAGTSTIEIGLLYFRRPLLALLLSAGSTSVLPIRTSEYKDPIELLYTRKYELPQIPQSGTYDRKLLTRIGEGLVTAIEYLLALTAIANLAWTSMQLSVQCICSFAPETAYLPILWAFTAILIHASGAIAVFLRYEFVEIGYDHKRPRLKSSNILTWLNWHIRRIPDHLTREFKISSAQRPATLAFRRDKRRFLFVLMSWFTSTVILVHLIFGTLVLSSTLFISTRDALEVIGRFLASTVACRAIVAFEMLGLSQVVSPEEKEVVLKEKRSFSSRKLGF